MIGKRCYITFIDLYSVSTRAYILVYHCVYVACNSKLPIMNGKSKACSDFFLIYFKLLKFWNQKKVLVSCLYQPDRESSAAWHPPVRRGLISATIIKRNPKLHWHFNRFLRENGKHWLDTFFNITPRIIHFFLLVCLVAEWLLHCLAYSIFTHIHDTNTRKTICSGQAFSWNNSLTAMFYYRPL